jgi:serine O-acetyltransferase
MAQPQSLWRLSSRLYRAGHPRFARGIRALIHFVWHAGLPYQMEVPDDIGLGHYGLGVVIHPRTTIGHRVFIWHGVTIAARAGRSGEDEPERRIMIEDDVLIGAHAVVLARTDVLRIGRGARIGAGAVVVDDVPAGATVVGNPARVVARTESS